MLPKGLLDPPPRRPDAALKWPLWLMGYALNRAPGQRSSQTVLSKVIRKAPRRTTGEVLKRAGETERAARRATYMQHERRGRTASPVQPAPYPPMPSPSHGAPGSMAIAASTNLHGYLKPIASFQKSVAVNPMPPFSFGSKCAGEDWRRTQGVPKGACPRRLSIHFPTARTDRPVRRRTIARRRESKRIMIALGSRFHSLQQGGRGGERGYSRGYRHGRAAERL